ncbi:family 20 glycosylhydrolase [Pedobacter sp. LMG 31464]|uniref:beta-N-acetylhexosaminidase n=1 Tax=Pedobacter planticolens TaxID=2679964 RepID=A0A923E3A0_9SPHI|nr:family 20 glycosylhydrolase [Pedobacter planticolens]MBB2147243.1 family 20 glycosylhydrolase [Pedobacter planticolens]
MKTSFIAALKITLVLTFCCGFVFAQSNSYSIIPQPVKLTPAKGSFVWSAATKVTVVGEVTDFAPAVEELNAITKKLGPSKSTPNKVVLKLDLGISAKEGYRLSIQPTTIVITASSVQGAFWAISSLKQLMGTKLFQRPQVLRKTVTKSINVPCVVIEDQPRFAWRGIHLDVSRHFFDLAYLHKMIDRMAYYKFNKFHLHLTDDQGWRIEIKKYPELTAKGAWREMNGQDSSCIAQAKTNPDFAIPEKHFKVIDGKRMYGGFYTQQEMKELIRYALNKGIEIIPEIDMPGHMMAATNLMPWLTSHGKGGQAKDFSEPLCPCKETTFEFAENVFTEIAELFPSKYIHLGADEVEKSSWKNVPECEALMKKEGLKSVDELQSYFVRRMEKFFTSKGKKLIGWDEILDGGVSPTATMMFWRSWVPTAPKHAAEKGNDVIMTPGEFSYFDAQQDGSSLQKVYSFDPYNYNLTTEEKKYILGVQANIWTEYIPSERRLEYMVFPRMLAMAEVAWYKGGVNWSEFDQRVEKQYSVLDAMNINYRLPDLTGFTAQSVFVDKGLLHIDKPQAGLTMRYTTDGTFPTLSSKIFSGDLAITKPVQVKVAGFRPNGNRGDIFTINYEQQGYLKPAALTSPQKGLQFFYYPQFYKTVNAIDQKDLAKEAVTNAIEIPVAKLAGSFATRHQGYFYAAETGIYSFALRSDDGSVLKLGGKVLIDNDGLHAAKELSAQIALAKGYHPFELLFIEGGGGYTLKLQYKSPNGKLQDVDGSVLFH